MRAKPEASLPLLRLSSVKECRIVRRENRFVITVETKEGEARAHINNTGRLEELIVGGRAAYILTTPHTAKTDFRLFAISEGGDAALLDTRMQMQFFERALSEGRIPWLKGCRFIRRDARMGTSSIDFLISCGEASLFLEIKSAVLRRGDRASYPDCPTVRGQKHVRELTEHVQAGGRAAICFMGGLPGVTAFTPDKEADPILTELLVRAAEAGVEERAVSLRYAPKQSAVCLDDPDLPVILEE